MRIFRYSSFTLVLASFLLHGCGSKQPEQAQPAQSPQSSAGQAQPAAAVAEPAPTQTTADVTASPPATSTAKSPSLAKNATAMPTTPQEQVAPSAQPAKATPKDVIVLKAPLGAVRFQHKAHVETRKVPCETCHHPSHAEKPATSPQQACGSCHTSTAIPPMKTKLQAAFHNPTATAGTCIDCHKAQNAKGGAAPVKCLDCHKKENNT